MRKICASVVGELGLSFVVLPVVSFSGMVDVDHPIYDLPLAVRKIPPSLHFYFGMYINDPA